MRDPSAALEETAEPYRWRWLILAVMIVAEIMDLLDASIVNVAGLTWRDPSGLVPSGCSG